MQFGEEKTGRLARTARRACVRLGKALVPAALALCPVSQFASQAAQTAAAQTPHPLWARLDTRLNSDALKSGDTVKARVSDVWSSRHCMIADGAGMKGTVVAIRPRSAANRETELTLHFTVACAEGRKVSATLIALLYPKVNQSLDQMGTYMDMPMGIGPGASGRRSTDVSTLPSPFGKEKGQQPEPKIEAGQVTGVRHVKLRVPAPPGVDSLLGSRDRRLEVLAGTRMAFRVVLRTP